jgi:Cell division protein
MRIIRLLMFAFVVLATAAISYGQIGISVTFEPPELPVYEQPPVPGDGYLWTPGYWAYDDDDYYWVPGTWVMAPEPGLLWTPPYWGWNGDSFVFNEGYWGPEVGFYGGVSYGYGYDGETYEGGRWQNGQFYYNTSVNNVSTSTVHNVYKETVTNTTVNRVSYNGGKGGVTARPTPKQEAAAHQKHVPPVAVQTQHAQAARTQPELRASANHGKPPVAATPKAGAFKDHAVVPAKQAGAPYNPPANRKANQQHQDSKNSAQPNRPPAAQPNNRPEPNRNEPQRRPAENSQPQRTPAPAEARPAPKQEHQQQQRTPEEKKKRPEEQKKQDEKPPSL